MISCLHILKFSNFTPISLLFPSFFFSRNPNDNFFSSKIPQKFKPSPFTEKSPVHLLIFFSFFLNSSKDLGFHHWTKQICKFAFPSKIVAQSIYWKKPSPFTDFFFSIKDLENTMDLLISSKQSKNPGKPPYISHLGWCLGSLWHHF